MTPDDSPKTPTSLQARLADLKQRLINAGLNDNDVTTVIVEVYEEIAKCTVQLKRLFLGMLVMAGLTVVVAACLTVTVVRALKSEPSPALLTAARQISDAANNLDAASLHNVEAVKLNEASANALVSAVDRVAPIVSELNASRQAFEAAKVGNPPPPSLPPSK